MKGLYKGKYLIAVYDKNDYLIDVAYKPSELNCYKTKKTAISNVSHAFRNGNSRIYFIDVTEKHNDIFTEEDEIFLDFVENTRNKNYEEKAKELDVSIKTYYRHLKKQGGK